MPQAWHFNSILRSVALRSLTIRWSSALQARQRGATARSGPRVPIELRVYKPWSRTVKVPRAVVCPRRLRFNAADDRETTDSALRDWAVGLFRCPACGAALRREAEGLACASCPARYPTDDDVTSFLDRPNAIVAREASAVSTLDGQSPEATERLRVLLGRFDGDGVSPQDLLEYRCLQHALDSRGQIRELLRSHPLSPGVVLEIGADHCWASSVFLDAGCRVIALDITDHLRLAPRASDPGLCRIKSDMNAPPLRDGSVDTVWATAAAHHSWDLGRTFREAARVLRPGGRLYFACEPMPSWLRYPFGTDFGHEERALGINETWVPRGRWLRLCATAGFEPELVFPAMDRETVASRLRSRHLPTALAPLALPFLRTLQVSIHLVATKLGS